MTNTNRIFAEIDYADQPQLELRMQTPRTGSAPVSYTHLDVYKRQHIAHAVHRLDVLAALRFNFVPHPADGRSQGVFCLLYTSNCSSAVLTVFVPYSFIDLMSGKYPTWMSSQICKAVSYTHLVRI